MKTESRHLTPKGSRVRSDGRWAWPIVILVSASWAVLLTWLELQKYNSFRGSADLAIYAQALWSTAHGRPFYISLLGGPANFLGHHFAPLLAVLVPLYRLFPDARLLLGVEIAALALAAVPLYAFARRRLGAVAGLLIVLAYFCYVPLHYVPLSDFHEIGLAVPLLMVAATALVDRDLRVSLLFLALATLVKEDLVFTAIAFGVYIIVVLRRRRLGLAVTAVALLWGFLLFRTIIPALNAGGSYSFYNRYATLGGSPQQMIRTFVFHPVTVLRLVSTPSKLLYVSQLLVPLAGLPLLGFPPVLLALPTLAILLLSDYEFMASVKSYYAAPLIPFLFVATVVGLQRVRGWRSRAYPFALVTLMLTALVTARLWSPLPGGTAFVPELYRVTDADRAARALLATIPPDASVASDAYVAWVANRFRLASLGGPGGPEIWPSKATEYLAVRAPGPFSISSPAYPWVVKVRPGESVWVPRYALVQEADQGLTIWKWRGAEHDVSLPRYDVGFDFGLDLVAAGTPPEGPAWGQAITTRGGTTLPVWMAWQAKSRLDERITFSLHLVDTENKTVAQVDREMAEGHFPTTLWHVYQTEPTIADEFPLEIPAALPPGRYRLLAGAFRSESVAALSRTDGGGQWVELAQIEIVP